MYVSHVLQMKPSAICMNPFSLTHPVFLEQFLVLSLESLDVPGSAEGVEQLVLRRRVVGGACGEHGEGHVKAERGEDQVLVAGGRGQVLKKKKARGSDILEFHVT